MDFLKKTLQTAAVVLVTMYLVQRITPVRDFVYGTTSK